MIESDNILAFIFFLLFFFYSYISENNSVYQDSKVHVPC